MMTHNGNDVIAPTAQAATPAVTFSSLYSEAALLSLSPFFVVGCNCSCSSSSSNVQITLLGADMHSFEWLLVLSVYMLASAIK